MVFGIKNLSGLMHPKNRFHLSQYGRFAARGTFFRRPGPIFGLMQHHLPEILPPQPARMHVVE
jgi:hypothetical protein